MKSARRPTLLAVDDSPENLEIVQELLGADYRIKGATSGARALEIAASKDPPDLILLDVVMPEMDGYDVCRRLKADPATKGIPVIFISARIDAEDEERGLALGAVDYIAKPFSLPIVRARVQTHLALHDRSRALEREVRERTADLIEAKERAEAANIAKSRFLSIMSHELRTPLNAVMGFAELLSDAPFGPLGHDNYRDYAHDIHDSAKRLLGLVEEILDLSTIEAGDYALFRAAVNAVDVAEARLTEIRPEAERKGLELVARYDDNLPPLEADSRAFGECLRHLLTNAVRFTKAPGRVSLSVERLDGFLRVKVADTGIGIAPENLERVADPFVQLEREQGRGHVGTGLGLALTRRLIELHGGHFAIASTLGEGTTVTLTLPFGEVP